MPKFNWRATCLYKSAGQQQTLMTDLFTLNEVKVVYSRKERASDRPKITASKDVYNLVSPSWAESIDHYETFQVLMLNRGNRVLGIAPLFV